MANIIFSDQGSVVQRHRKFAIQCKSHANLSQLIFAVVQRDCNIYGARNHNANPLNIVTGFDLLQTPCVADIGGGGEGIEVTTPRYS